VNNASGNADERTERTCVLLEAMKPGVNLASESRAELLTHFEKNETTDIHFTALSDVYNRSKLV
jgi:hypothetical protein